MNQISFNLGYYPLDLAAQTINRTNIELLILAHEGAITCHLHPDPTYGLIEWDSVSSVEIGAIIAKHKKVGNVSKAFISEVDIELTDLVIKREELIKAHEIFNRPSVEDVKKVQRKTSPKTDNHIAKALKSFLYIQYGADATDNIYRELKDSDSQISKDFRDAGLKHPEGKALENHLRQTILDVIPILEKVEADILDE